MVNWSSCRSFFDQDGSLRDIYVPGGGLRSWNVLLLIAREVGANFEVDGEHRSMPASAQEALALRPVASPLLSIDWQGIWLNAHFFGEEDVELDLNPAAINSSARFEALVSFMRRLAKETGRSVTLTPENCRDDPYLQVHPVTGEIASAS